MLANKKRGRKPKYTHVIILRGVNAKELQKKLKGVSESTEKLPTISPIIEYSIGNSGVTTSIESLNVEPQKNVYLNSENISVLMKDHVEFGCLPNRTDLYCWHDRNPFTTSPIGLPIKYIPPKPDTTTAECKGTNDYFLCMGVFCSFPCCLAYISEHQSDPLLKNSKGLLYLLYTKLYSTEFSADPAPSWKHLKEYGGLINISEFRKSFCSNYSYVITNNIKRPFMVAVGNYTEEKRCY